MLNKQIMVSQESALPGRTTPLRVETQHFVNHSDITAPVVGTQQEILLGMGCFWGAERLFLAIGWRGVDFGRLQRWLYAKPNL